MPRGAEDTRVLKLLRTRLRQGLRTLAFPPRDARLPERFRGRPFLDSERCRARPAGCEAEAISGALRHAAGTPPRVDLGLAAFSPEEADVCPEGAWRFTREYAMATRTREALRT